MYNSLTNTSLFLGIPDIIQLQFKDRLYFARLLFGLYFIQDNEVYYYTALQYTAVDDFVIDKNDDIYYRSGARIYRFQHPHSVYLFTHRFAKLAVDANGELYYSVFDEVFKFNYERGEFDSIGFVANSNMFDHVFDASNNLVYYDISGFKRVYKLSSSELSWSVVDKQIIVQSSVNNN